METEYESVSNPIGFVTQRIKGSPCACENLCAVGNKGAPVNKKHLRTELELRINVCVKVPFYKRARSERDHDLEMTGPAPSAVTDRGHGGLDSHLEQKPLPKPCDGCSMKFKVEVQLPQKARSVFEASPWEKGGSRGGAKPLPWCGTPFSPKSPPLSRWPRPRHQGSSRWHRPAWTRLMGQAGSWIIGARDLAICFQRLVAGPGCRRPRGQDEIQRPLQETLLIMPYQLAPSLLIDASQVSMFGSAWAWGYQQASPFLAVRAASTSQGCDWVKPEERRMQGLHLRDVGVATQPPTVEIREPPPGPALDRTGGLWVLYHLCVSCMLGGKRDCKCAAREF
ncbi:hypothetical protein P4O66_000646 [Electrophorus voltai]|uniref:Uncharacterized protein n=1 Tax=Electrophorus voltai TaxID=2609070 RepID=A0AAD9E0Q9_9TELE|nr:hypothetical protein P4O66_000646 [Electrophorus voltai]